MSWSVSTGVMDKLGAEKAIEDLMIPSPPTDNAGVDSAVWDQLQAAKRAALELLKTVPGPNVYVNLAGHANGVGCLGKPGVSDDCITVTVAQQVPTKP